METSTIYIKGYFKIEVPKESEIGMDMEVSLKGSIVQKIIKDNQDGTVDLIYCFKPTEGEVVS